MQKSYAVIVLGLGEAPAFYKLLVKNWSRRYDVTPILYVVGWREKSEGFDAKLSRLVGQVESLTRDGNRVALIGVSAGASASLNARAVLAEKHVHVPVYSICGRFNLDHHWWYPLAYGVQRMPAFEESVAMAMQNVLRLRVQDYEGIRCFRALFDEVVPKSASILSDAKKQTIPISSHHLAIYFQLFFPRKLITPLQKALAK